METNDTVVCHVGPLLLCYILYVENHPTICCFI